MEKRKRQTTMTISSEQKVPSDFFFWLGPEGELEGMTEQQFIKRQKNWDGPRPQDFEEGHGG